MPYLFVLAGSLAAFAYYVNRRPSRFELARSLTMDAPAAAIFPRIDDFHQWAGWLPWDKLDPAIRRTYSGAERGVGAKYHWVGNKKVGEGESTILASTPDERIEISIRFLRPFAATNRVVFTLEPVGTGTRVTWAMDGTNDFMAKAFRTFVDMDKVLARDFDNGLAAMRDLAVKRPAN